MAGWSDRYWTSPDGLWLHYRDYAGDPNRPPILCIPGLTRNQLDFEAVAVRLAPGWRLLCVDLRGRGESAYAPPESYVPSVYVADVEALLAALGIGRFVAFGTSLGGVVAMLLASRDPSRIAGALLNDVGPEFEATGIARIRSYVERARSWESWEDATHYFAEAQKDIYPDWEMDRWLDFTLRLCCEIPRVGIVPNFDGMIARPLLAPGAADAAFDLWPALRALAGTPALLVRGALSDLLSEATAARMAAEVPGLEIATVPRVGHAPTLEEPEAVAAIDRLLARVAAEL